MVKDTDGGYAVARTKKKTFRFRLPRCWEDLKDDLISYRWTVAAISLLVLAFVMIIHLTNSIVEGLTVTKTIAPGPAIATSLLVGALLSAFEYVCRHKEIPDRRYRVSLPIDDYSYSLPSRVSEFLDSNRVNYYHETGSSSVTLFVTRATDATLLKLKF